MQVSQGLGVAPRVRQRDAAGTEADLETHIGAGFSGSYSNAVHEKGAISGDSLCLGKGLAVSPNSIFVFDSFLSSNNRYRENHFIAAVLFSIWKTIVEAVVQITRR